MKNNNNTTAKQVNIASKQANEEFKSLTGCLRALQMMDNKPEELKDLCKKLHLIGAKKQELQEIAKWVANNTPYFVTDENGDKHPADKVTKKVAVTTEKHAKQRTTWTFRKVLETVRVIEGTKEAQDITALLK